jgi:hypothetical protein
LVLVNLAQNVSDMIGEENLGTVVNPAGWHLDA